MIIQKKNIAGQYCRSMISQVKLILQIFYVFFDFTCNIYEYVGVM